jgi:thymidylate synthase
MNNLDKQYTDLLQDILDNGVTKQDRTGTGTLSLFGKQIRHKMSDGFPLLTTKKMPFKLIATELMWFLRGDTNIKFLVDNDCHIWDGDAYKAFKSKQYPHSSGLNEFDMEDFIIAIKNDDYKEYNLGELGPIYGKQWRKCYKRNGGDLSSEFFIGNIFIDQIANLINDLKTNPDSRRLMVNAWNVGELNQMVLPPCHYGFQVYTRELTQYEKYSWGMLNEDNPNIPTRAISLMWNQRSVDTFLGLPFNIASYGLLLEIIAKAVNMVPDELIGNLGDTHLYLNHIEQAKEQIGREFAEEEIQDHLRQSGMDALIKSAKIEYLSKLPTRTRQPYPLPTLNINTEFWPTESGECGEGPIDAQAVFNNFTDEHFCKCLLEEDLQLSNYQSHPHIKAPLSN